MPPAARKPRVLLTSRLPPEHLAPLAGAAEVLMPEGAGAAFSRDDVLAAARGGWVEAVVNSGELVVDPTFLDAMPGLRVVANMAAGFNNFDLDAMAARGIWATNAPDAFTDATADLAIALLLAVVRRVAEGDRYVRSGRWRHDGFRPAAWDGLCLRGKTLGVVGFGRIGRAVAARAEAFGMRVVQFSRSSDRLTDYLPLDELVATADAVSVHLPLSAETRHFFGRELIAKLNPRAVLINVSRGPVVDERALLEAVREGRLAGAGLDVFEHEPDPLPGWAELDNVVLTPHIGGSTTDSRADSRLLATRNVALVFAGKAPETPLNQPGAVVGR